MMRDRNLIKRHHERIRRVCIISAILITFKSAIFSSPSYCQSLTLNQTILIAQEKSPVALQIRTSKDNKYWQWEKYKSEYKPQLVLNLDMPHFQKQNIPVRQEDGSVLYKTIDQSNSFGSLSIEQNIGFTGGLFI